MVLLQLFLLFQLLQFFLQVARPQWGSAKTSKGCGTTIGTSCKFDICHVCYGNGNLERQHFKVFCERCHSPIWSWPNQPKIPFLIRKIPKHLLFLYQLLLAHSFLLQLLHCLKSFTGQSSKLWQLYDNFDMWMCLHVLDSHSVWLCSSTVHLPEKKRKQQTSPFVQLQLPTFAALHLLLAFGFQPRAKTFISAFSAFWHCRNTLVSQRNKCLNETTSN